MINLIEALLNVQLQYQLVLAVAAASQAIKQQLLDIVGRAARAEAVAVSIEEGFMASFNSLLG